MNFRSRAQQTKIDKNGFSDLLYIFTRSPKVERNSVETMFVQDIRNQHIGQKRSHRNQLTSSKENPPRMTQPISQQNLDPCIHIDTGL